MRETLSLQETAEKETWFSGVFFSGMPENL